MRFHGAKLTQDAQGVDIVREYIIFGSLGLLHHHQLLRLQW